MTSLERKAKNFAKQHHVAINQVRKYTSEPYINHPAAVVEIVRSIVHTDAMIAAAWLHDTVEDTDATLNDIQLHFGDEVANLVEMLTDVSRPADGNRAVRKLIDLQHTAKASATAKTIKLADLIENSFSIVERDRAFAQVYLREKRLLLEVLKEGDIGLWHIARNIAYQELEPA